jgi:YbaB/EbfC DNA-binding family protein
MSLYDDLETALADLRAEQARIREAGDRMRAVSGTAVSKDRMITAAVDAQGRLVELRLDGDRYRRLAPAELTARIVETVRAAQDDASRAAASAFAGCSPPA